MKSWGVDTQTVTIQADDDSLIERERFIIEPFHRRSDFLAQDTLYQLLFHYARTNFSKSHQTSIPIIRQRDPAIGLRIGFLPPLFLERLLPKPDSPILSSPPRGYHVPSDSSLDGFGLIPFFCNGGYLSKGIKV